MTGESLDEALDEVLEQALEVAVAQGRMTGLVRFAKLQGAGNDFVVVDGRGEGQRVASDEVDWSALARSMCDRHFGVGADGLLVAATAAAAAQAIGIAHRMRMFNPDGTEAEMCGNGLRCFGRWLLDHGEIGGGRVTVETGAGLLEIDVGADGWVTAGMGRPSLAPVEIPLSAAAAKGQPPAGPVLRLPIQLPELDQLRLEVTCVSMGNPHAVVFVADVNAPVPVCAAPEPPASAWSIPRAMALETIGPHLERHPFFPARTNVELCQVVAPDRLRVRVWERGAGLTLACGTGACAAMVAARLHGYVGQRVIVELPGGELEVAWPGPRDQAGDQSGDQSGMTTHTADAEVTLRGPAEHVFDGQWLAPSTRRPVLHGDHLR